MKAAAAMMAPMGLGLTVMTAFFFAAWATTHILVCWAVARVSFWRGACAFLLPLLVPLWSHHTPKLLSTWGLLLVAYGASLVASLVAFS